MTDLLDATSPQAIANALETCDREPIRVPGSIQPHGALLALDPRSLVIRQCSANCLQHLGRTPQELLGQPVEDLVGADVAASLAAIDESESPRYLRTRRATLQDRTILHHVLAHRTPQALIVEFEETIDGEALPFDAIYPVLQSMVSTATGVSGLEQVCSIVARQVRQMTGFDRALIYQFDDDWNGIVLAEDRNDRLPSYLGQRFPASDIPAQARELYRLNPVRQIPDAGYEQVPLEPVSDPGSQRPLDLSFAGLRSVSPIHVEYMRNMGTAASMSVSIVVGEKLWGLISCHNRSPLRVPFHIRTSCAFVAQVLSQQLVAHAHTAEYARRIALKTLQSALLARMAAAADFLHGLTADPQTLLNLTGATGAAIVAEESCMLLGQTPSQAQVRQLAEWLEQRGEEEVFATSHLAGLFPPAAAYSAEASGVLAVSFSKLHARYLIWFRPEQVRTLTWAGDPAKSGPDIHTGRIHPRRSFDAWKQIVRQTSAPWSEAEIDAATELRNNVVGIVLRKAEELAEISGELERSNKELEAFSYSVSHDLRAPFRHIVGYAELVRLQESAALSDTGRRYLDTIIESAQYAGTLVDNLLTFSQMGRSSLRHTRVDLDQLIRECWRDMQQDLQGRNVILEVDPLPVVSGDLMMLRLVVQNLLSNAVKYTRGVPQARVHVSTADGEREHIFWVRDNGVGFDMKYVDKLFGVFQRLHKMEEFEGTGIGLANVRRIIGRHGGRTWAEGVLGKGATVYFTLPKADLQGVESHG